MIKILRTKDLETSSGNNLRRASTIVFIFFCLSSISVYTLDSKTFVLLHAVTRPQSRF